MTKSDNNDQAERVAATLAAQHAARARFEPLTGDLALGDLDQAYAAQKALIRRWETGGRGPLAGWKIALTSKAVQELVGLDHPCVGGIFASTVHDSPAVVRRAGFVRLGLEFELCLRLGADLDTRAGGHTADSVRAAVDAAVPAFELIEDRDSDYSKLDAASLVADNCWCGGIVLGSAGGDWRDLDLATTPVRLDYNGEIETATTGAALGNPLNALAWVADKLADQGRPLRAGQWVMTGSTLKTRFPLEGDRATYAVEGLGSVSVEVV
ncbi:MAG: fumarylacetoacetate hydrolase family protein [Alphaproteobacteria bacterium]|nr:fumarylacetoacetate hydrolase family protein [Alphaproteobacteria bacterium]